MRPLLAINILPELQGVDAGYLAELVNRYLDREFGSWLVSVRPLTTEDELRAYQAGELVLYRKPARRHGDRYEYERDGQRVVLEQTRAFDPDA